MANLDPSGMVHSVTEAMKGNPSCLAAIMLAALFGLLNHFSIVGEREEMQERQMALIERCQMLNRPEKIELLGVTGGERE